MNYENVEKTKQNTLAGMTCNTCAHKNNSYCPYEPDARHERPQCCHKHSEGGYQESNKTNKTNKSIIEKVVWGVVSAVGFVLFMLWSMIWGAIKGDD
jgi:hypothetical protein